jgi:hypothetical protein
MLGRTLSATKAEEHPRRYPKPNQKQNPNATRKEVVLEKYLLQRAMLEYQPHEGFKRDGKKYPN